MEYLRVGGLVVIIGTIIAAIYYLEVKKPDTSGSVNVVELAASDSTALESSETKQKMFPAAKEIVSPSGFVNVSELTLKDLIGKQIILVDFWTYSCINCQRTQPYLNAWQKKYGDQGLTIVGVHTPEFEFEKDITNVQQAVQKAGISYPVVLDNDYATWRAYGNRYWPRKYLIDLDGYIVYDHIGEGGYDETEKKIQELLADRQNRRGELATVAEDVVQVVAEAPSQNVASPEVYFGASRNELLGNGESAQTGEQQLTVPSTAELNRLYLGGTWQIQPEYAQSVGEDTTITFRYKAKNVYMVAAADTAVSVTVNQGEQPVGSVAGADVDGKSQVLINDEQLYHLIQNDEVEEHTLHLNIQGSGFKAFTFTFG